ncbi:cytochrome b/b6 domain-containing protein [Thiolinea disciformis]|uniref:cytochrome b/b6 domain-containing protein n=1 Tax=Thiolinea disciformis TaxID=125614 RepID=UPI00037E37F9|nr:cytochrome b/b6 domain-containing protein [Thiolinea disciformis]
MLQRILVWDLPTRVFHWSLALSFLGAYLSSETERYRNLHIALGYVLAGLIIFRLIWGLVGSPYAKFNSFLFKPSEIIAYLKSLLTTNPLHYIGHNPAGSLAVYLLLALGALTAFSGMGLYFEWGGSFEESEDFFEEIHEFAANGMLIVVLIHIAGVVVSSVMHKENLPRCMVTGYKQCQHDEASSSNHTWLGLAMLVSIVGFLSYYLLS